MLLALETIMSEVAISTSQVKSNIQMGKYGDWYCARHFAIFPTALPDPSDPRGYTRLKRTQALLATIKLKSYRQQTVTITQDPSTSCKLYTHANQLMTATRVTPAIITNDYYYSHASNS